jgi:hypothetical protein
MKVEAELRVEWMELDEALEVLTRRIALIGNHLRFCEVLADPEALEGQLLQAGRAARSGFKGVAAVPANL